MKILNTLSKNQEIEVTKKLQANLISCFSGVIAHRKENDKYFIKLMDGRYKKIIDSHISQYEKIEAAVDKFKILPRILGKTVK